MSPTPKKSETPKVFWNEMEKAAIVHEAALFMKQSSKMSYSAAMLYAMDKCKGIVRKRPHASVAQGAKATFGKAIDREVELLKQAEKLAAETPTEPVHAPVPVVPATEVGIKPDFDPGMVLSLDGLKEQMEQMISHVGSYVENRLRIVLSQSVTNVSKEIRLLSPGSSQEISAVNLKGKDAKWISEKVGYCSSQDRGSDVTIATAGLETIYDFRIVNDVAMAKSLKDCHVLVRHRTCSHKLWIMAKALSPSAIFIEEKAPNAVNEELTNRYLKQVERSK